MYSVKQVAKLDDPTALDELFEELKAENENEQKTSRWNKNKSDFLEAVNSYTEEKPSDDINYEFFAQFLQANASLNNLLLSCHPTLIDCNQVFNQEYYRDFFKKYCDSFLSITERHFDSLDEKYKDYRVTKINVFEQKQLTGGMNELVKKGVINYNAVFYRVEFLEDKKSEYGLNYSYFCYLNRRWVFFPKPWRH